MKKSISRFSKRKARNEVTFESWHNGANVEVDLYAGTHEV
jgi:hypothetical protein